MSEEGVYEGGPSHWYNPTLSTARVSDCGLYRYHLGRTREDGPRVLWIMLNPSKADGSVDDPTLLACIEFTRRWGFTGLDLVNLFAFRSEHPLDLLTTTNPVGPHNDAAIDLALSDLRIGRVVCAWGSSQKKALRSLIESRAFAVRKMLRHGKPRTIICLGRTKDHKPRHPLYIAREFTPLTYEL